MLKISVYDTENVDKPSFQKTRRTKPCSLSSLLNNYQSEVRKVMKYDYLLNGLKIESYFCYNIFNNNKLQISKIGCSVVVLMCSYSSVWSGVKGNVCLTQVLLQGRYGEDLAGIVVVKKILRY